jgi:hypothetical protein
MSTRSLTWTEETTPTRARYSSPFSVSTPTQRPSSVIRDVTRVSVTTEAPKASRAAVRARGRLADPPIGIDQLRDCRPPTKE